MIKRAMVGFLFVGLVVSACSADVVGDQSEAMAGRCCACQAAPRIYPPGSISSGMPVTVPMDSSGTCSGRNGQAGSVNLAPYVNYSSPGLHDCYSVPSPSGGCPNAFTPSDAGAAEASTPAPAT